MPDGYLFIQASGCDQLAVFEWAESKGLSGMINTGLVAYRASRNGQSKVLDWMRKRGAQDETFNDCVFLLQ
jgi:hypothetical protein